LNNPFTIDKSTHPESLTVGKAKDLQTVGTKIEITPA
jgi:hypothetical protein